MGQSLLACKHRLVHWLMFIIPLHALLIRYIAKIVTRLVQTSIAKIRCKFTLTLQQLVDWIARVCNAAAEDLQSLMQISPVMIYIGRIPLILAALTKRFSASLDSSRLGQRWLHQISDLGIIETTFTEFVTRCKLLSGRKLGSSEPSISFQALNMTIIAAVVHKWQMTSAHGLFFLESCEKSLFAPFLVHATCLFCCKFRSPRATDVHEM